MKLFLLKHIKYSFICILILLSNLVLSGCWSKVEVNNMAIISIMGIDSTPSGEYELTVQVIKPQELYRNSANGGGNDLHYQSVIETGKGKSLVQAMSHLSERISNRIYLGHVLVVVLGERAARDNLQESMDFLTRENHFRPNMKLLVTNGDARSILNVKPRLETTLGAELDSFLKNTKFHPTSMVQDVAKFMEADMSEKSDPYTGVINLEGTNGQNHMDDTKRLAKKVDQENDHEKLVFSGTAVFKKNGLMGFLNENETEGFLWTQGKVANDIIVLNCQGGDSGTISLKVNNTQSHMTPKIVEGKPVIEENIKVNGDIRQITCKNAELSTEQMDGINKRLKQKVLSDIHLTFQKVKRDWQADVFGFGEIIYKKYPQEWDRLAQRWTQGELRNLKVNIRVDTNISNYGLVRDTE